MNPLNCGKICAHNVKTMKVGLGVTYECDKKQMIVTPTMCQKCKDFDGEDDASN